MDRAVIVIIGLNEGKGMSKRIESWIRTLKNEEKLPTKFSIMLGIPYGIIYTAQFLYKTT